MGSRILYYSDEFGAPTTTFIYNEVVESAKTNEILYLTLRYPKPEVFPFNNVKVLHWKENIFIKKLKWWLEKSNLALTFKSLNFSKHLGNAVQEFKPDIIHLNFGYEALRFLDNFYDSSIPVVVHFHGYDASYMLEKKAYTRRIKEVLGRRNVYTIIVTDFFLENFHKKNIYPDFVKKIYYGIKAECFKRSNFSRKENLVFYQISSLLPKKGHEYSVIAFSKLVKKLQLTNVKYIIAGSGPLESELKDLVKKQDVSEYVEFVGYKTPGENINLMNEANFFIHHSITTESGETEGIPNAIMEAMAMELPVLSTYHAGIPELVENGVNGFLVEEKNINEMAKMMEKIMSWEYKKDSRKKIEEMFSIQKHNEDIQELYKHILSKKE